MSCGQVCKPLLERFFLLRSTQHVAAPMKRTESYLWSTAPFNLKRKVFRSQILDIQNTKTALLVSLYTQSLMLTAKPASSFPAAQEKEFHPVSWIFLTSSCDQTLWFPWGKRVVGKLSGPPALIYTALWVKADFSSVFCFANLI